MTHARWTGLAVALAAATAGAWGFDGHRKLASMMHEPLPDGHCLKDWLKSKQSYTLQDSACDPDRWRSADPAEWSRHHLHIDALSDPKSYPREWTAAVALFGGLADNNGQVPWRVAELYASLVKAFESKDEAAILKQTFVLSHYASDAFSVLHDTKNFDPNGLHNRWESDMFSSQRTTQLGQDARGYYGVPGKADPLNNIFDIVLVGQGLVAQLIAADQKHPQDMNAFYGAVRELTGRRMADAVVMQASFVWSAWTEAGKPQLAGFGSGCGNTAASAEPVLKGYPVPGGFTHPATGGSGGSGGAGGAGGSGGTAGAGGSAGAGGMGGGAGGGPVEAPDAGEEVIPPASRTGCSSGGAFGSLGLWAAVLLLRRRHVRRSSPSP